MRMTDPELRDAWLKQLASHSEVFPHSYRGLRHRLRRGHLVCHRATHPEATSTLIHNFVFGWAMEWVLPGRAVDRRGLLLHLGIASIPNFISR